MHYWLLWGLHSAANLEHAGCVRRHPGDVSKKMSALGALRHVINNWRQKYSRKVTNSIDVGLEIRCPTAFTNRVYGNLSRNSWPAKRTWPGNKWHMSLIPGKEKNSPHWLGQEEWCNILQKLAISDAHEFTKIVASLRKWTSSGVWHITESGIPNRNTLQTCTARLWWQLSTPVGLSGKPLEELYYLMTGFQYPLCPWGVAEHQWCIDGITTPVDHPGRVGPSTAITWVSSWCCPTTAHTNCNGYRYVVDGSQYIDYEFQYVVSINFAARLAQLYLLTSGMQIV